jgi:hypothetical protein
VIERLRNNPVSLHPEQVARTIVRAATVARPRRSYPVGALASAMLGIRSVLPDVAWEHVAFDPVPDAVADGSRECSPGNGPGLSLHDVPRTVVSCRTKRLAPLLRYLEWRRIGPLVERVGL